MVLAHVKIALRSFMKNKGYTLINVLGLSIGMAIFFLIALYVKEEVTADRFHENIENIYRIETDQFSATPMLLKKLTGTTIPEIEELCRFTYSESSALINYDDRQVSTSGLLLADSTFFEIFSFKLLRGDPASVLDLPHSLVLSESEAEKIFQDEDPIGKSLRFNHKNTFTVTGIMKDFPSNSSIWGNMVGNIEMLPQMNGNPKYLEDYNDWSHQTFVLLSDHLEIDEVSLKLNQHLNNEIHAMVGRDDFTINFLLMPLKDVYFHSGKGYDRLQHGSINYVYIYSAVGIFILLIAVINFINLATATASRRCREVGLKKVIGASRKLLMRQFLVESVLISLFSFLFAALLFELLVPVFNRAILANLTSSALFNFPVLLTAIGFSVIVGVLAGLYPAFYLTKFQPAFILKGESHKGRKGLTLRHGLIIFQFTVSIILIIATIVIFSQMQFARNVDVGFNKEHVVYFYGQGDIPKNFDAFTASLKSIPEVQFVSASSHVPGYAGMNWGRTVDTVARRFYAITCLPEYVDLLGLELIEGRNFYKDAQSDIHKAYIVNETFVKDFDLKNPVGTTLADGKIVGVVRDFSFRSVHSPILPLALAYVPSWCNQVSVRLNANNIPETMDKIEEVWGEYAAGFPFEYTFLDQAFDRLYRTEERLAKLFGYFSLLAVFIAGIGLAGLALFSARQRTREIGVRKVFGASRTAIVGRMVKEFLIWVAVANIIAWPVALLIMSDWLERFAYHVNPQLWMFLLAALTAFLIAFVTVSFHAWRAASVNPTMSLRYE
ncbi:MAG: ABC transporter permease [Bacteroidales bacterium]